MTGPGLPMPMFPLGAVLFPSLGLPLHVFEPRYRDMTRHLLTDGVEPEFGVVLIERGREVGGGDVRSTVGTVARLREAAELPDGRWALLAVGVRRLRVLEWLPDDPWPRALVEDFPDRAGGDDATDAGGRWQALEATLRRVLALAAELGEAAAAATIELNEDPGLGSFQAAAVSPLGPADQYRVLAAAGVEDRLTVLAAMLDEQAELLDARLRLG